MTTPNQRTADPDRALILILAVAFFAVSSWGSFARWANFEYRTFDLAYYVQALWQLIHGRFQVSVEGVPLLGNHVEPIVFLIAPLFLVFRHPLVFVLAQNAALASMGPVAFEIGRQLGLARKAALCLAAAILITPATGYIALHEFHPEAFTAPFLLLMIHARVRGSLRAHWGWLIALLACKENMALLIAAYGAVHAVLERKRPLAQLRAWYLWPMALSVSWFLVCTKVITPTLNSGNIDYLALYDRLGGSAGEIALNAITRPQLIFGQLLQSIAQGNLLWGLLLPFLALPILKPRWLLIAAPILLQHLLSWRSSEWTIYFHYAAPLVPLFWIALAESAVAIDRCQWVQLPIRRSLPYCVLLACAVAQIFLGPAGDIAVTFENWSRGESNRARKRALIKEIPPDASVLAPLPYLSHLAMREDLYSLHYILKGLKTLSRSPYTPPSPTKYVLIDYEDFATFDAVAGYYHPAMKTVDGRVVPSSERLLHDFLKQSSWTVRPSDELTLLQQGKSSEELPLSPPSSSGIVEVGTGITLTNIAKSGNEFTDQGLVVTMDWILKEPRDVFPWLFLKLTPHDARNGIILSRGLCAPEATSGPYRENWRITPSKQIPAGDYRVEAFFIDNARRAWATKLGQVDAALLVPPIPLGDLRVPPEKNAPSQN